jgi:hypothetical protein
MGLELDSTEENDIFAALLESKGTPIEDNGEDQTDVLRANLALYEKKLNKAEELLNKALQIIKSLR